MGEAAYRRSFSRRVFLRNSLSSLSACCTNTDKDQSKTVLANLRATFPIQLPFSPFAFFRGKKNSRELASIRGSKTPVPFSFISRF